MAGVEFEFTGERILVTGAARGIGHAVAEAFARAGVIGGARHIEVVLAHGVGIQQAGQGLEGDL